jgi:hypothetical protein
MSAIIELKSASKDACPDSFQTVLKGKNETEHCPPLIVVMRDQFTVVAKVLEGSFGNPIESLDINETFRKISSLPEVTKVAFISIDRDLAEILFSRLFIEREKK